MPASRLLVLSNGHGEDLIARRILEQLRQRAPSTQISVLPLVGEGHALNQLPGVKAIGPRLKLPSGGFSNQSASGLLQDLRAGLASNSWQQWRSLRRWARQGGRLLAVGDLLPLALARASGLPYGFIGTPKSDYTWSSGPGSAWPADAYHRLKGSEWDPWEWALMGQPRCRLVLCRDRLTARGLQRHGIAALAPGNPMMDGFSAVPLPQALQGHQRLLLLPGSRNPEAIGNLERLLVAATPDSPPSQRLLLLACGSSPDDHSIATLLQRLGYNDCPPPAGSDASRAWHGPAGMVLLGRGCFERWGRWAQVGLACAGTATEQLVGLGCPALSLPGPGPQFKVGFAQRQSRLLGGAVRVCRNGPELRQRLELLLAEPQLRHALGLIGQRRMGPAGGSAASAALIERQLLS